MNSYAEVSKNDTFSSESLVLENLELVKRIAHHLAAKLPATVDVNDLVQSGMVGLLEAANNFDASHGASFETYAGIRIRGSMLDDIRKHDWTPRSVHHKYRQVAAAIRAIEGETGAPAQAEEIAKEMGVSLEEYHKILSDSASARLFSYEETLEDPSSVRQAPKSDSPLPDEILFKDQFQGRLSESIKRLPEREQMVLSLYYERDLNLKEIAAVLGVSESRICQLHGQAVVRLRTAAERW